MLQIHDVYQAYYTKSEPIINYMVSKLDITPEDMLLEPCGGDGVFIDHIINLHPNLSIDVYELNPESFNLHSEKYNNFPSVNIKLSDTLLDDDLDLKSQFGGFYDKIIANPPYGAWQDYEKRKMLKKKYDGFYVKESYALFLSRAISLLKPNGILSFIIPDTFLNLHMHKKLRKKILTETKVLEIALFPSSFFPGVNFGYANLSIITLQKSNSVEDSLKNYFTVYTDYDTVHRLGDVNVHSYSLKQQKIYTNSDYAFYISKNPEVYQCLQSRSKTIGNIADCVTGFYSGNDKKFLRVFSKDIKNGKAYIEIDKDKISKYHYDELTLDGIKSENHFIPIIKGGNGRFLKKDNWFLDWSKDSVAHYKTDKKARFQNSQFYFKRGIGVPMISSTRISASLIENNIFDQSIVGIFPHNENIIYFLLAFFNSNTCNQLIRTINPSANNPSNYIKKIPFIDPTENQLAFINHKIKSTIDKIKIDDIDTNEILSEIDVFFKSIYGF